MKIRRIEIRVVPVRGRTKVYAMNPITIGPETFRHMCEMMNLWMVQMDRLKSKQP